MTDGRRFRVPRQKVVHETIDGEAILIQLDTGYYYSLGGTGAEIWALLDGEASKEEILEHLRRCYEADPAEVESAVDRLLGDLAVEELIELDGRAAPDRQEHSNGGPPAAQTRAAWVTPELQRFTDMQDFLRLDPIHEVDDAGWPHRRAAV